MKLNELKQLDVAYTGSESYGEDLYWVGDIELVSDTEAIIELYKCDGSGMYIRCNEIDGTIYANLDSSLKALKLDWITFYRKIN